MRAAVITFVVFLHVLTSDVVKCSAIVCGVWPFLWKTLPLKCFSCHQETLYLPSIVISQSLYLWRDVFP